MTTSAGRDENGVKWSADAFGMFTVARQPSKANAHPRST